MFAVVIGAGAEAADISQLPKQALKMQQRGKPGPKRRGRKPGPKPKAPAGSLAVAAADFDGSLELDTDFALEASASGKRPSHPNAIPVYIKTKEPRI